MYMYYTLLNIVYNNVIVLFEPCNTANFYMVFYISENLKTGRGQYSEKNIERTSQFIGSLSKDLDRVFQKQVSGTWVKHQSGGRKDYSADVYKFVEEFKGDCFFEKIPGREHSAFPGFHHSTEIKLPGKLKSRLKKYTKKLDTSREILPN